MLTYIIQPHILPFFIIIQLIRTFISYISSKFFLYLLITPFVSPLPFSRILRHFKIKMYPIDEYTTKSINLPSLTICNEDTFSNAINPKYLPNNLHCHDQYVPLNDLTSINPTHATPLSPNDSINHAQHILCSEENEIMIDKEHEDQEQEIRRIKRMISNRESARRSRLRKRKQLENLQHQVFQLLAANHQLANKLNEAMESNYHLIQENAQLKQEAAMLMTMKGNNLEEGACNSGFRIRASKTITSTSMDVLQ